MTISAGEPIGGAVDRTFAHLFGPFRWRRWAVLGVGAGLTLVGEGMPPIFHLFVEMGWRKVSELKLDESLEWVSQHTMMLVLWLMGAVVAIFPIYVAARWVSSRGQFVFFDNLVTGEARVRVPWREHRRLGNSLTKFRIWWDLMVFNLFFVVAIVAGVLVWPDVKQGLIDGTFHATGWTKAAVVVVCVGVPAAMVVWWVASSVFFGLAVPLMYVRGMEAKAAFRLARELFLKNKGACLRYFVALTVFEMVFAGVTEMLLLALGVVTLCLGCVVMVLPVVGNYPVGVASVPAMTFRVAYQFGFLGQFGEEYRLQWNRGGT